MSQRKPGAASRRLVWRISERFPLGAFVDPVEEQQKVTRREPRDPEVQSGWMVSSFELSQGAEVSDCADTVPADLFDELFPAAAPIQAPPEVP